MNTLTLSCPRSSAGWPEECEATPEHLCSAIDHIAVNLPSNAKTSYQIFCPETSKSKQLWIFARKADSTKRFSLVKARQMIANLTF